MSVARLDCCPSSVIYTKLKYAHTNQIKSNLCSMFHLKEKRVEEIWQRSVDILFMAFQAHTVRFKNTKCAKHVYVRIEAVGLLNYFTHTQRKRESTHNIAYNMWH